MVRVAVVGGFAGVLAALLSADGRASLHHPEDQIASVPVDSSGKPEELPFDEFARRRITLRNSGDPSSPLVALDPQTKEPVTDPKTGQPILSDRGRLDARIKLALKKKGRTADESDALAVDWLRFGRPDEAESVLQGQRRGFLPNVTLAHTAMAQAQWARAYDFLDIANGERPPAKLPGTSPKTLEWQLQLNKGPLLKLVKLRLAETRGPKLNPEDEQPDRLFDVNFVNAAGQYEPGVLADSEKAKLPSDAIATVQQLALWLPFDARLYWLLAELYAATGDVKTAAKILDQCAWSLNYSNRKVLMQHRELVSKAAGIEPPPDPDPPSPVPFTMREVWWYFGAVGVLALLALVRAVLRWRKA